MKKSLVGIIAFLLFTQIVSAKKVRFTVDMRYYNDNLITGIHVAGDFQAVAGYPGGDWNSGSTLMTSSGDTNYYSVIVDIPAFRKYEYKFINGDQWYEAEFIPFESRVGYNFNDNRWIYIDSLANDTTQIDPVLFGGNAPEGMFLTRYLVDMSNEIINSPDSIHIAGDFQGWNNSSHFLFSFVPGIHEIIIHDSAGTHEYKYLNGEGVGDFETVPNACATNGNRSMTVLKDSVLNTVCFSSCSVCIPSGINNFNSGKLKIFPQPSNGDFFIEMKNDLLMDEVLISDVNGKMINKFECQSSRQLKVNINVSGGIYFLNILSEGKLIAKEKIIIQN